MWGRERETGTYKWRYEERERETDRCTQPRGRCDRETVVVPSKSDLQYIGIANPNEPTNPIIRK